jgi:hypothetical protein
LPYTTIKQQPDWWIADMIAIKEQEAKAEEIRHKAEGNSQ